eukprot:gene25689-226_t
MGSVIDVYTVTNASIRPHRSTYEAGYWSYVSAGGGTHGPATVLPVVFIVALSAVKVHVFAVVLMLIACTVIERLITYDDEDQYDSDMQALYDGACNQHEHNSKNMHFYCRESDDEDDGEYGGGAVGTPTRRDVRPISGFVFNGVDDRHWTGTAVYALVTVYTSITDPILLWKWHQ